MSDGPIRRKNISEKIYDAVLSGLPSAEGSLRERLNSAAGASIVQSVAREFKITADSVRTNVFMHDEQGTPKQPSVSLQRGQASPSFYFLRNGHALSSLNFRKRWFSLLDRSNKIVPAVLPVAMADALKPENGVSPRNNYQIEAILRAQMLEEHNGSLSLRAGMIDHLERIKELCARMGAEFPKVIEDVAHKNAAAEKSNVSEDEPDGPSALPAGDREHLDTMSPAPGIH